MMDPDMTNQRMPNRRTLPPLNMPPPQPEILPETNAIMTTVTDSPVKKRRRKKKKTVAAGSQEALVHDDQVISQPEQVDKSNNAVKPRRKKRPRNREVEHENSNIGLATELYDLNEDVIMSGTEQSGVNDDVGSRTGGEMETYNTGVTVAVMRSEPTDKLFIEQRNGFKVADKTKVAQKRTEDDLRRAAQADQLAGAAGQQSTVDLALFLHYGLQKFFSFMRGMLAGISLWQIISTAMLLNQGADVFLGGYFMLASPVQCLYFLLFAVSTVSVLDRYDPIRPSRICMIQSVTCQIGSAAVLFYSIGLIFTVSTAFLDERIGLYQLDPMLWNNTSTNDLILYQWSILNLIRGLMAMLGFIMVCFSRPIDRLKESLYLADENILNLEDRALNPLPPTGTTSGMRVTGGTSLA